MERTLYDLVYRLVMFNSHRKRKVQMDYHIYFEPSSDYSILEIEERAKELHKLMKNNVGKNWFDHRKTPSGEETVIDVKTAIENWLTAHAGEI